MDTGNNTSEKLDEMDSTVFKLKKYRDHYIHMCTSGFDPLICTSRTFNTFNYIPIGDQRQVSFKPKTVYNFIDLVINEERYVDLLKFSDTKVEDLDNIIFIPSNTVIRPMGSMISSTVAIFWLYPSGCHTLGELYRKYEKKIKDELKNRIIT